MNDIKIAEKNIRESFRNMAASLRNMEREYREYKAARNDQMADWFWDRLIDTKQMASHMRASLSWAGYKVTYTGYSKYFFREAGDPHVAYVGFADRKEA